MLGAIGAVVLFISHGVMFVLGYRMCRRVTAHYMKEIDALFEKNVKDIERIKRSVDEIQGGLGERLEEKTAEVH